MATTVIPWGDPKAVKIWAPKTHNDVMKAAYFTKKFVGKSQNNIIEERTELAADSGDTISFDLSVRLKGEPTFGDNSLDGKEEALSFYTDTVKIDQVRKSVSAGGRMTRKRTIHNLRQTASRNMRDYWKAWWDELCFMYLSGARGVNEGFIMGGGFTGFAGNVLRAPDSAHILYGGSATSKASLTTADVMSRVLIERASVMAEMMSATDRDAVNMVPLSIEGEDRYVTIMSPFQAHQLRTGVGTGDWLDIQKAAMGAEGANNRVMKGGLGMINNVVLHQHRNVIRFSDYGAGSNVLAARALFLGRQAGAIAYGTSGSNRMIWVEETKDFGNQPTVAGGYIGGMSKVQFNGKDYGVIALDTHAPNPN